MSPGLAWNQELAALRRGQVPMLDAQLRRLWRSSVFLRDRWKAAGWDRAPTPDELSALPMVTKADLKQALDHGGLGSHLACDPGEVRHICATSGTSGRPTYFGLTRRDHEAWIEAFCRGFRLGGATAGDIVLHAFAMSRGYAGGVPMVAAFERMGCTVLAMGAEAGSARLAETIQSMQPSLLYASPSMLRRLGSRFEEETGMPASDSSVSRVLTGGEPGAGDPGSKATLSRLWGAGIRECGGGSDICPLMWAECAEENGLHFVAGDEVLVELVEPNSDTVIDVGSGARGELVYTHLQREANPIIRMRHADIVDLESGPCPCGLLTPRIRFLGRADDLVIVRGVKVYPSSVQQLVSEFSPPLSGLVALRKPTPDEADQPLELLCEVADGHDADPVRAALEERARAVLGVRVRCRLASPDDMPGEGHKATWIVST